MSMLLELARHGRKAGHVCHRSYRNGPSCPLILRTTSEDAMTANVFGILRWIRPTLWLRPLLNQAFATRKFRTCSLRDLGFSFWHSVPAPTAKAAIEGESEIDVLVRSRALAVLIEAKYQAPLASRTAHDQERNQVIRLLDVAFELTTTGQMFTRTPYVLVLGSAAREPELVTRYRDPVRVEEALSHRRKYPDYRVIARRLSRSLAYASWTELASIIELAIPRAGALERGLLSDVVSYLRVKMETIHLGSEARRQLLLPVVEEGPTPES
jgi:hypothetical protein